MTRDEFVRRFHAASVESARIASEHTEQAVNVPTEFEVRGIGSGPAVLAADAVIEALYLGPELSRVVIDVGVLVGADRPPRGWIVASQHPPRSPSETWDPDGLGPFKPIGPVW
jgi:hypothetical protein